MKLYLIASLLLAACWSAYAQNRPPEIEEQVRQTGRYALHDHDLDGWDDLWTIIYSHSRDGRNFIDHIKNDPDGDLDGDGVSNFQEMLDFRNPYGPDTPIRPQTPEEAKAARLAAARAAREDDAKKIARFHAILEARGALVRSVADSQEDKERWKDTQVPASEETSDESSFYDDDFDEDGEWLQIMLCSTGTGPRIIFSERLSTRQYLLAWEGDPERLFNIEWSDDLQNWKTADHNLPTIDGIGTWGQFSPGPKRFYRVVEVEGIVTPPSHPSGGDGPTTFGATLTPVMNNGAPSSYLVTANLPPGMSATGVELVVDGETHSQCTPTGVHNIFTGPVKRWHLHEGHHAIHAVIHAISETTAVLEQEAGGVFRSLATTFALERQHLAVGFRVNETMIAPDDPELPTYTEIAADIMHEAPHGAAFLRIRDEDSNIVREWIWDEDDYPLEIRETWDGTDDGGSPVDGGSYSVSLEFGGAGFTGDTMFVAAGERTWKALVLAESLHKVERGANDANFQPP